jgi:hypothetical protein
MRGPILSLTIVAVTALVRISTSEAALISFDLNAPDAALQGTTPPYATVTVSTQGTGTATFDVVADGPYSLASIFFQISPNTAFLAPGKATITGGVSFGGFDPTPLEIGGPLNVGLLPTDQFGAFSFGYKSNFGTVKTLSFTLTGPFIDNIAAVIIPNAQGILAAGQIYNGDATGFVGGNGSPTPVATVAEPAALSLFAPALLLLGIRYSRAKRVG